MNENVKKYIQYALIGGIATIITVGIFVGYPKLVNHYKIKRLGEQLEELAVMAKSYKDENGSYAGISNTYINESGVLPDGTIGYDEEPYIYSTSGAGFIFYPATDNFAEINTNAFVINVHRISKDICVRLATRDWAQNEQLEYIGLSASLFTLSEDISAIYPGCPGFFNPNGLVYSCPNGKEVGSPVSKDLAEAACDCADNMSCSVILKFK